jgi:hypothetical protein
MINQGVCNPYRLELLFAIWVGIPHTVSDPFGTPNALLREGHCFHPRKLQHCRPQLLGIDQSLLIFYCFYCPILSFNAGQRLV